MIIRLRSKHIVEEPVFFLCFPYPVPVITKQLLLPIWNKNLSKLINVCCAIIWINNNHNFGGAEWCFNRCIICQFASSLEFQYFYNLFLWKANTIFIHLSRILFSSPALLITGWWFWWSLLYTNFRLYGYEYYCDWYRTLKQKGINCSVIDIKSHGIIECRHVSSSQFYYYWQLLLAIRVLWSIYQIKHKAAIY